MCGQARARPEARSVLGGHNTPSFETVHRRRIQGDDLKTPGDGATRCEIEEVQANEGCSNGVLREGRMKRLGHDCRFRKA